MKLLQLLQQWEIQIHKKLTSNPIIAKSIVPVGVLVLLSELIWILGPKLTIGGLTPFADESKRIYAMLFIFLLWLLKFLLVDIVYGKHFFDHDVRTKKKLKALEERFNGALKFSKYDIKQTPWLLLIGPKLAGKTSMLANANINFILKKQFNSSQRQQMEASENCDWWVTRQASLIDVPSHYLYGNTGIWQFFLKLIKLHRGKNGINGILIALPAAELMNKAGQEHLAFFWRHFIERLQSIKNLFNDNIPCQIIITKCDLVPGFKAFFAESSLEEIEQTCGIYLNTDKSHAITDIFNHHFNGLIKKINQQLLFRLHHEKNPMLRPEIKDFPLQLENLKVFIGDFIKKLNAYCSLKISSVYLTSACQTEKETLIIDDIDHSSRMLQLYNNPYATRPYFIKQLLENGLIYKPQGPLLTNRKQDWLRLGAYAMSFMLILTSGYFLGKDFEIGIKKTYAIQKDLTDFQMKLTKNSDPIYRLTQTIGFLNLIYPVDYRKNNSRLAGLLSHYSNKASHHNEEIYQTALLTILLPELRYFLEEHLKYPINKDPATIYSTLASYLMLSEKTKFDPEQFVANFKKILPTSISTAEAQDLITHLSFLFQKQWPSVPLNNDTIEGTRKFLKALPKIQLGFIILKSSNNNDLSLQAGPSSINYQIETMFMAKNFMHIMTTDVLSASQATWVGNWVLGHDNYANGEASIFVLAEELKKMYIDNYVSHWEKILANINFINAEDLTQLDAIIVGLLRHPSPLISLLKNVHENTFFEPIASMSEQLKEVSLLATNDAPSQQQLLEILKGLESVHLYIQPLLNSPNKERTAFDMLSMRMGASRQSDPLLALRIIAEKNPEPIRSWLLRISDLSVNFLIKDAAAYIDTSWQTKVIKFYNKEIANRYPFAAPNHPDVDIQKFITFFGHSGKLLSYINQVLKPFIDMSGKEWHWKSLSNNQYTFKEDTLRQIQLAMKIHKSFFPENNDNLNVQFTLQPYEIGKSIKNVTLNINNKLFIDDKENLKHSHLITWPTSFMNATKVTLTLNNNQTIDQYYPGDWGWLKLINQSFESILSKKQFRLNLSMNENSLKYLLSTEREELPFASLDLKHFHLPQQLIEDKNARTTL